jgi:hypothetical protein
MSESGSLFVLRLDHRGHGDDMHMNVPPWLATL